MSDGKRCKLVSMKMMTMLSLLLINVVLNVAVGVYSSDYFSRRDDFPPALVFGSGTLAYIFCFFLLMSSVSAKQTTFICTKNAIER